MDVGDHPHTSGTAEREAALAMLERRGNKNKRVTVRADKGYDSKAFIEAVASSKVTPHVAAATSTRRWMPDHPTRGLSRPVDQKVRKRIEEAFGWIKTVGGLAKTKLIGQAKLTGQALLCLPPTTWCAWAASAAGGTRIM